MNQYIVKYQKQIWEADRVTVEAMSEEEAMSKAYEFDSDIDEIDEVVFVKEIVEPPYVDPAQLELPFP